MRHMFGADGRAVFVAIDHAAYMGGGPPLGAPMCELAAGRPDGVLATWRLAREYAEPFAGSGLVLRVDGGSSELGEMSAVDHNDLLYSAEQAVRIGADCVVVLAFPGAPDEDLSLKRLARLCAECGPSRLNWNLSAAVASCSSARCVKRGVGTGQPHPWCMGEPGRGQLRQRTA